MLCFRKVLLFGCCILVWFGLEGLEWGGAHLTQPFLFLVFVYFLFFGFVFWLLLIVFFVEVFWVFLCSSFIWFVCLFVLVCYFLFLFVLFVLFVYVGVSFCLVFFFCGGGGCSWCLLECLMCLFLFSVFAFCLFVFVSFCLLWITVFPVILVFEVLVQCLFYICFWFLFFFLFCCFLVQDVPMLLLCVLSFRKKKTRDDAFDYLHFGFLVLLCLFVCFIGSLYFWLFGYLSKSNSPNIWKFPKPQNEKCTENEQFEKSS